MDYSSALAVERGVIILLLSVRLSGVGTLQNFQSCSGQLVVTVSRIDCSAETIPDHRYFFESSNDQSRQRLNPQTSLAGFAGFDLIDFLNQPVALDSVDSTESDDFGHSLEHCHIESDLVQDRLVLNQSVDSAESDDFGHSLGYRYIELDLVQDYCARSLLE